MSAAYASRFQHQFPRLGNRYRKKSSPTDKYNCIAWAMGEYHRPWWPGSVPEGYWPADLPPEETIENFVAAFEKIGYELCVGSHHEWRFQKIVIYADSQGIPTHAARLSLCGTWISKLGQNVDISHRSHDLLDGPLYGTVVRVMKRPWTLRRIVSACFVRLRTWSSITACFPIKGG